MNLIALNKKVEDSGLRRAFIAKKMRITTQSLGKKLQGKSPITVENAACLCEIIPITDNNEKVEIFLSQSSHF